MVVALRKEKKILMSRVAPPLDDHFKAEPSPDREMTVEEFLSPAVNVESDHHLALLNTDVSGSYEKDRYVEYRLKINDGDRIDQQGIANPEIYLPADHQCYIDQGYQIRARRKTHESDVTGNHDQNSATPEAREEARGAGRNVYEAVLIRHPDQRQKVVVHLHQIESDEMVTAPTQMAGKAHDKLVTRGRDGASFAKGFTRRLTNSLGFDDSLADLSSKWDADIIGGHVHLNRHLRLRYRKKFDKETWQRDFSNFKIRAGLGIGLWLNQTRALDRIATNTLAPEFRKVVYGSDSSSGLDGLTNLKKIMEGAAAEMLQTAQNDFSLRKLALLKEVKKNVLLGGISLLHKTGKLEPLIYERLIPWGMKRISAKATTETDPDGREKITEIFSRAAHQALNVIQESPHVDFADGLTLKNMRPKRLYSWYRRRPKRTKSGATHAEVMVFNTAGYDGGCTYGAMYADTGYIYRVDWKLAREQLKDALSLPDKPLSGNDLLVDHIKTYGGFRRETLDQYRLAMKLKGASSNEVALKYAQLPEIEDMPIFDVARDGTVKVTTPDGRPVVMLEGNEVLLPHRYLQELRAIDIRAAQDWDRRIAEDSRLRKLFEPEEEFTHVMARKPIGRRPSPPQYVPVPASEREYSMA